MLVSMRFRFLPEAQAAGKAIGGKVQKISDFLRQTNRFDKTIVFFENIDHAERMRQALVNENYLLQPILRSIAIIDTPTIPLDLS